MKNYLLPHQDNEILKEINHEYPKAMAVLHYDRGFNYSKPYRVIKHSGKFTLKSLEKDYSITSDDNVAILSKDKFFQILHLYVYPDGKNVYDYRDVYCRTNMIKTCVYDFATKKSFEEVRKAGGVFYIFIQNKNDSVERSGRILNKRMNKSFRNYTDKVYSYYREEKDKSGYSVRYYKESLMKRMKKYHDSLDVNKLDKAFQSEQVSKHFGYAKEQKETVANLLMAADITFDTDGSNMIMLGDIMHDISDYITYISFMSMFPDKERFDKWHQVCEDTKAKISGSIERYKEKYIKA